MKKLFSDFFSVFSLCCLHLPKVMLVTKWELMLSLGRPSVLGLGKEEERGDDVPDSELGSGCGLEQGTLYNGLMQPWPILILSRSLRYSDRRGEAWESIPSSCKAESRVMASSPS